MVESDGYVLGRGKAENDRLVAQNELLIRIVGFVLHPTITRTLPDIVNVREIASGPGEFLKDLAKELSPDAQIDGTDYSNAAFLPKDQLPANVTLNVVNAKLNAPEDARGKYDLVCIRFMNVAMQPEDWEKVARHAWQLLKPGGAIQWIEGDFLQCCTPVYTDPEADISALREFLERGGKQIPNARHFVFHLPDTLKEVGFRDVQDYAVSTDRLLELREATAPMFLGAIASVLEMKATAGVEGAWSLQKIADLRKKISKELEGGAYMRCDLHSYVGFKA